MAKEIRTNHSKYKVKNKETTNHSNCTYNCHITIWMSGLTVSVAKNIVCSNKISCDSALYVPNIVCIRQCNRSIIVKYLQCRTQKMLLSCWEQKPQWAITKIVFAIFVFGFFCDISFFAWVHKVCVLQNEDNVR